MFQNVNKWEGLCKHYNELCAFQNGREFIDKLRDYQFLKEDFFSMGLFNTFELCTGPLV
jgi:hypothetical protein